jgi:hypothetical protein
MTNQITKENYKSKLKDLAWDVFCGLSYTKEAIRNYQSPKLELYADADELLKEIKPYLSKAYKSAEELQAFVDLDKIQLKEADNE